MFISALIQPSEAYAVGVSPTPWIVILIVMVCIMFAILVLTLFMAWKWKSNRSRVLRDHEHATPTHAREPSPQMRYPQVNIQGRPLVLALRKGNKRYIFVLFD
jgi:flagellar basal body-associated protein FliL